MTTVPPFTFEPVHEPLEPLVSEAATQAWAEAEEPVAPGASPDERLVHAVRTAVLAPSVFNTQPWAFQPRGGGALDLLADRPRQLPSLDPDGRLLAVSCGAALFLLSVGAARNGLRLHVRPVPDFGRPDLLATVEVVPGPPEPDLLALAPAVTRRRTHRGPFESRPVAADTLAALEAEAQVEGAALLPAPADLADLVVEATDRLGEDGAARRDFAEWLRPIRASTDDPVLDGVPDYVAGEWGARSYTTGGDDDLASWGAGRTESERRLVADAPAALVLATRTDNPFEWLAAGQAHARALLRATLLGVSASYVLGPLLVPDVRAALAEALGGLCPQVVLRLGHVTPGPSASPLSPTPRRPLSSVLR
ncbi:MAG TPA: hypothetical protein VF576_12670 [Rubricoccaceae bacterium]